MHCPNCGGTVIFTEGCKLCINCGWSPCYSAHRRDLREEYLLMRMRRLFFSS